MPKQDSSRCVRVHVDTRRRLYVLLYRMFRDDTISILGGLPRTRKYTLHWAIEPCARSPPSVTAPLYRRCYPTPRRRTTDGNEQPPPKVAWSAVSCFTATKDSPPSTTIRRNTYRYSHPPLRTGRSPLSPDTQRATPGVGKDTPHHNQLTAATPTPGGFVNQRCSAGTLYLLRACCVLGTHDHLGFTPHPPRPWCLGALASLLGPTFQMSSMDIHSSPSRGPLPRPWNSSERPEPESGHDDEFVCRSLERNEHQQLVSRKSAGSSTKTESTQPPSDDDTDDMDDRSSVDMLTGAGPPSGGASAAVAPRTAPAASSLPTAHERRSGSTGSTTASEAAAGVGAGADSDSSTESDDSFSLWPSRKRR